MALNHCPAHRTYSRGCEECQHITRTYQAQRKAGTYVKLPNPCRTDEARDALWLRFNALGARLAGCAVK